MHASTPRPKPAAFALEPTQFLSLPDRMNKGMKADGITIDIIVLRERQVNIIPISIVASQTRMRLLAIRRQTTSIPIRPVIEQVR